MFIDVEIEGDIVCVFVFTAGCLIGRHTKLYIVSSDKMLNVELFYFFINKKVALSKKKKNAINNVL